VNIRAQNKARDVTVPDCGWQERSGIGIIAEFRPDAAAQANRSTLT
jgi:hypothetical protein